MTFNVRVFGYRGTQQIKQINPSQFTSEINEVLYQPYEWSQNIPTNGATAVTTVSVANDLATIVVVEIPDGQSVRYEWNTIGRAGGAVNAGNNSPRLSGQNVFMWSVGTLISFVEASFFL